MALQEVFNYPSVEIHWSFRQKRHMAPSASFSTKRSFGGRGYSFSKEADQEIVLLWTFYSCQLKFKPLEQKDAWVGRSLFTACAAVEAILWQLKPLLLTPKLMHWCYRCSETWYWRMLYSDTKNLCFLNQNISISVVNFDCGYWTFLLKSPNKNVFSECCKR